MLHRSNDFAGFIAPPDAPPAEEEGALSGGVDGDAASSATSLCDSDSNDKWPNNADWAFSESALDFSGAAAAAPHL
eukprot:3891503-Prymnesium_polylepis.1